MYDLTNHRVHNGPETDGLTDYVDVRRCQDTACSAQRGSDLRKKGKGKKKEKGKEKKRRREKEKRKKEKGKGKKKKGREKGKKRKETNPRAHT